MNPFRQIALLMRITRSQGIIRRYFVVNGFDGALTMLGLIIGFIISGPAELSLVIGACLGAAIALGVSGVSSAYISEVAERRRALTELEEAMVKDLHESAHGQAARWIPLLIALVNGSSPLFFSMIIISPLWLANAGVDLFAPPLVGAITIALMVIFLLGVFLGRISGISKLRSGLQALFVALITATLIFLIAH